MHRELMQQPGRDRPSSACSEDTESGAGPDDEGSSDGEDDMSAGAVTGAARRKNLAKALLAWYCFGRASARANSEETRT